MRTNDILTLKGMSVIAVLEKQVKVNDGNVAVELKPGDMCLIPANEKLTDIYPEPGASFLSIRAGS